MSGLLEHDSCLQWLKESQQLSLHKYVQGVLTGEIWKWAGLEEICAREHVMDLFPKEMDRGCIIAMCDLTRELAEMATKGVLVYHMEVVPLWQVCAF